MRCLWCVSPKPLGQACWRCLVSPILFRLGVLGISALGRDVLHPSLCALSVGGLCVGCGRLPFVVGLWWVCSRWMFGRCAAYMVWVGVFSLCGCDMMSGLLPRIYPYNFVSCISLKFLCTLSIESLSFFPIFISLFGCSFRGFRELCHTFFFS